MNDFPLADRVEKPRSKIFSVRRIFAALFKVCLIAIVFFVISLFMLASLSGNGDAHKSGMEGFFAKATGLRPTIGRLAHVGFYPEISVDLFDLEFFLPEQTSSAARIGHLYIKMGFWDVFLGRHLIGALDISNVRVGPEITNGRELRISSIVIGRAAAGGDAVIAEGTYGDLPVRAHAGLTAYPQAAGKTLYRIENGNDFGITAGTLDVTGTYSGAGRQAGIAVEALRIGAPQEVLTGGLSFLQHDGGGKASLDLKSAASAGMGVINIVRQPGTASYRGEIDFRTLELSEFAAGGEVRTLIEAWKSFWGREEDRESAEFAVRIEELRLNGAARGSMNFVLKRDRGVWTASEPLCEGAASSPASCRAHLGVILDGGKAAP